MIRISATKRKRKGMGAMNNITAFGLQAWVWCLVAIGTGLLIWNLVHVLISLRAIVLRRRLSVSGAVRQEVRRERV